MHFYSCIPCIGVRIMQVVYVDTFFLFHFAIEFFCLSFCNTQNKKTELGLLRIKKLTKAVVNLI